MLKETKATKISIATLLIGIAGFIISLYTFVLHLQGLGHSDHTSICDISAKFNCTDVINSAYGELGSIPLGAYGMTYFIIMLVAAWLPRFSVVTRRQQLAIEALIGFLGFLGVLSLLYISNVILGKICPSCSVIHLLITIYFVMKLVCLYQNKNLQSTTENSDYLKRFFLVSLGLGVLPLIAGIFAPLIIMNNLANADTDVAKPLVTNAVEDASLQDQMMRFNPTNNTGNGEDYRRGSDKAKIILQMFSDFGCPHCKRAIAELQEAQDEVGLDNVLIVYRFFPLNAECNAYLPPANHWYPYGCVLPQAARCAGQQGKFWEFKDWGFSGQDWTEIERKYNFSTDGLSKEAKKLGMDSDKFMQCIESGSTLTKIRADEDVAEKLKIQGTPYIIINGEIYNGDFTKAAFVNAFHERLDTISANKK